MVLTRGPRCAQYLRASQRQPQDHAAVDRALVYVEKVIEIQDREKVLVLRVERDRVARLLGAEQV